MGDKMKRVVPVIALTMTAATGCFTFFSTSHGRREDRDVNYTLEAASVSHEFHGTTDYEVVVIPENHNSYGCQANIYLTLESMLDNIRFVAREGRVGPTEHTLDTFQKFRYYDQELNVHYYRDLITLSIEDRKKAAHQWIFSNQFPSQFSTMDDWRYLQPMIASVLLEAVYQDTVRTIGVEDKDALEKANAVASKSPLTAEDKKIIVEGRNKYIVENIHSHATSIASGNRVPLPIGLWHVPDLMELLKTKGISYRVVEHKPCVSTPP